MPSSSTAHPPFRRRGYDDVLAPARHLRMPGVVTLHVTTATAAGGVDGGFQGGGDEGGGFGGVIDGRADVADATTAVGGFG